MILILCTSPDNAYICTKFGQSISKDCGVTDSNSKKGLNSVKTVDGVMVLNLYTSSDDALYCTKFQENISKGFTVI